jgi:hypothetical protein
MHSIAPPRRGIVPDNGRGRAETHRLSSLESPGSTPRVQLSTAVQNTVVVDLYSPTAVLNSGRRFRTATIFTIKCLSSM